MFSKLSFEWDSKKENINLKKHRITFLEASTVFGDRFARIANDEAHSITESREIIMGESSHHKLLLVVFTELADRIRIISARLATPYERQCYEENK